LPRGFIAKLFLLQRKKCTICRRSIEAGYHVDHITALAKGGKHEPWNIQLLCATCNVRKSAKDPIEYMQSRGYLL
jgi:5-methylcytosine-specific restriction endonuclease McrA